VTPFGLGVRAIAAYNNARFMNLRVIGAEHVPRRGPALLAARHYHHLFDGAALVLGFSRQPHIFVALDWTRSRSERRLMEAACRLAGWPVALREDNLSAGAAGAFERSEVRAYVRRSLTASAKLLARGELLAIFPEGYPTIDPAGTRKLGDDAFLPFAPGVAAIAARAQAQAGAPIPVVPIGFTYARAERGRFDITMRAGEPLVYGGGSRTAFVRNLEERVRELSRQG
jgi:putative membrane protein